MDRRGKKWTIATVTEAREAVAELLEELGLEAYLFSVEPSGEHWEVRVERPSAGGWRSTVLTASDAALLSRHRDGHAESRRRLLDAWGERLGR